MSEENTSKFKVFWTICGGAIVSVASGLLVIVLSMLNGNINSLRSDHELTIGDLRKEIGNLATKIGASEGRREANKSKYESQEAAVKAIQERLSVLEKNREADKEKIAAVEKMIELLKEADKEIKSEIKAKKGNQ